MTFASFKYLFGLIFVLLLTGSISSGGHSNMTASQDQQIKEISDSIQYYKARSHMFLELARIRVDSAVARANRK